MYKFLGALIFIAILITSCNPKLSNGLRKNDLKKDVEMVTDHGTIVIRLSDSTPLHRDNFLKVAKSKFYDSVLFHRVIKNFMIQGGDPTSKNAKAGVMLGEGDIGYTIPAEFRASLFHKRGVIAAARSDNPAKESSGCQFYIVQGKKFTDAELDAVETSRMKRKMPLEQREVYKTLGGSPWLDQNYTVFGEVIKGLAVVDSIGNEKTDPNDRPLKDVRIISIRLIKR